MGSIRPDSRVVTEKRVAFYRRSCPNSGIVATVFCCEQESARSKAAGKCTFQSSLYTFQCRCEAARQIVFVLFFVRCVCFWFKQNFILV